MADALSDIKKLQVELLLHEYDIFNGRISSLMVRMSGTVAAVLACVIAPLFKDRSDFGGLQLAISAFLVPAVAFLFFQITAQMLVYKRHMTHIARKIKGVHESLELQWDLVHFNRIYHQIPDTGGIPCTPSVQVVVGVLVYLLIVVVYVPLFEAASSFVWTCPVFWGLLWYIVTWGLLVAGPVLLAYTVKRLNRAYPEISRAEGDIAPGKTGMA